MDLSAARADLAQPDAGTSPFSDARALPGLRTFEQVYDDEFPSLVRMATAITGSVPVAEDVVQDAFANLYLRFARVEQPTAYLRRSVVNGCTSRFRRHSREDLGARPDDRTDTTQESASTDRIDLAARLATLTPRQRAVVVLRIQHGLPESEVADLLGCRPGTVGSLLHRALTALRIEMEELP
ncbi:MAG: sigma-70 family RNA polymerase sigma factor [Acidimicrobiales bacterium]